MAWEFWTFLSITLVRQVPQLWLELRSRGSHILHRSGSRSTAAMFALYIAIWVGALVYLAFSEPSLVLVIVGGALVVLGTGMRFLALAQLGPGYSGAIIIRKGHRLTTSGLYGLVRHPLHLALLVELLGMVAYTNAWWLMPLWVILYLVIHIRNISEDGVLRKAFGSEAVRYQASTPGMNPLARIYRRGGSLDINPLPPGSYGWPLIGETLGWMRDPEDWVKDHLQRYGSIFKTRVLGRKVIVMIGPRANEFILWSHRDHFEWGGGYGPFVGGLFPGSLSTEDGALHDQHRDLLAPFFRARAVEEYFPLVLERTSDRAQSWTAKGKIIAFDECRRLTLDIVARVLAGPPAQGSIEGLAQEFETLSRGLLAIVRWDLPGTTYRRALEARRRLENWIRTAMPAAGDSLLGRLAPGQGDAGFTEKELVAQVLSLLFDGQDTTGSVMTWLLLELHRHPEVLDRLREEVGSAWNSGQLRWGELSGLRYLDAVVQEVGRLHHPAPALPRRATKGFQYGGYRVQAGALVLYSPAASHRLPQVFQDPEQFEPERFLPPREEHRKEPFGLVTFGGGPRACLGAPLALMEIKTLAAVLAMGYRWSVAPGQDLRPRFFATKRPRSGLRLQISKR